MNTTDFPPWLYHLLHQGTTVALVLGALTEALEASTGALPPPMIPFIHAYTVFTSVLKMWISKIGAAQRGQKMSGS